MGGLASPRGGSVASDDGARRSSAAGWQTSCCGPRASGAGGAEPAQEMPARFRVLVPQRCGKPDPTFGYEKDAEGGD